MSKKTETFLLFSRPRPPLDLGMVDPKSPTVDVALGALDVTIHQSPGVLSSSRSGGTTGAVLWKVSPLFAEYISAPSSPLLSVLGGGGGGSSSVLELGCGVSPLNALSLSPHVAHYVLSDQGYVHRVLSQNLAGAVPSLSSRRRGSNASSGAAAAAEIDFRPLDWETDVVAPSLSPTGDFDLVLACDCVYNDALVRPFVQVCVDACRLRQKGGTGPRDAEEARPCICLVAQQLRTDEVFHQWITEFHSRFHVWRFPDPILPEGLKPDDGFVIHAGVLRD